MEKREITNNINIRLATDKDSFQLTELCEQLLGYSVNEKDISDRVKNIISHSEHAIFVAEDKDKEIVGYVHVHISIMLHMELQAELGGFVVKDKYRELGIGSLLIKQAEEWAKEHQCQYVYLRSRVSRDTAHMFYEKRGYRNIKTQYAFRKQLG